MRKILYRVPLPMVEGFIHSHIHLCRLGWTASNINDIRTPSSVEVMCAE